MELKRHEIENKEMLSKTVDEKSSCKMLKTAVYYFIFNEISKNLLAYVHKKTVDNF